MTHWQMFGTMLLILLAIGALFGIVHAIATGNVVELLIWAAMAGASAFVAYQTMPGDPVRGPRRYTLALLSTAGVAAFAVGVLVWQEPTRVGEMETAFLACIAFGAWMHAIRSIG
jgi:hypothetical protein